MNQNIPAKAGFWWARSGAALAFYDRLVRIEGTAPFLRWTVWDLDGNVLQTGAGMPPCYFGHEIEQYDSTAVERLMAVMAAAAEAGEGEKEVTP